AAFRLPSIRLNASVAKKTLRLPLAVTAGSVKLTFSGKSSNRMLDLHPLPTLHWLCGCGSSIYLTAFVTARLLFSSAPMHRAAA
ncbi:MAG: hypothetical protein DMG18_16155, partial [Acidobacteria bacterium]